ncbi:MAG: aminotransferase class III-fold pyridoxal phosphate-dependent enzyme [Spirosomaceae bacterium]|nr:aminotransferase class III-fold pyridoxal phosphate-dependent enzyme [Spirosomataceae bacterium]
MQPFNVYPLYDITPVKALGSTLWDNKGEKYLDMYGGHAVISIGHAHPYYVEKLTEQLNAISFYSNSVQIPLQQQLAKKLGELSGLPDFNLFLVSSGAEANENALKLASFHTKRKKIIAFKSGFHGRTSAAVAATDNPKIKSLINDDSHVVFLPFNDAEAVRNAVDSETCAVIVEGIQGVGGIHVATDAFMAAIRESCDAHDAVFIHDSVQCGYGRSGKFFTWELSGVKPDIITTAKGMGNGFPIGGVLISPKFEATFGMLGTTFGGNHLACMAALSVLEVIEKENLLENTVTMGEYLMSELKGIPGIKELRGVGLMIGIEMEMPVADIRKKLLFEKHVFTGVSGTHTLRLLPSLALTKADADIFLKAFKETMDDIK